MESVKIWNKVLGNIKGAVDSHNFRTWFSKTTILSINGKVTVFAPSAFVGNQLKSRYFDLILSELEKTLNKKLELDFQVNPGLAESSTKEEGLELNYFQPQTQQTSLNPRYTLENFVVGLSNNVAFAAAQAVVANPGVSYNPLFIYGGTGVGKTHLMLGIGNAMLKANPNFKVIYSPSEKFMNDYVEAIKTNRMGDLRSKYRFPNVLLIDDIQFFSGREGTQEEFFHTFNELQNKNAQMVLTSDRTPNEIAKLEDRLKSRFQGGLMVDIQLPDFDTRVAILKAKCEERGESLPEGVLQLLASSLESNIRELEGKLIQILQASKTQNLPLTPESLSRYLQQPRKSMQLDPKKVLTYVCGYFNLNLKDLSGPKRQKELVLPRHIAMYLLTEELRLTVEKVGSLLGGRDHTTVMHGRDRIKKLIVANREIQRMVVAVKQSFPQ